MPENDRDHIQNGQSDAQENLENISTHSESDEELQQEDRENTEASVPSGVVSDGAGNPSSSEESSDLTDLTTEIEEDRQTVEASRSRMLDMNEEVESANSEEKRNEVMDKLRPECTALNLVFSRIENDYAVRASELKNSRFGKDVMTSLRELDRQTGFVMRIYNKHRETLRKCESEQKIAEVSQELDKLRNEYGIVFGEYVERTKGDEAYLYPNFHISYSKYKALKTKFEDVMEKRAALPAPLGEGAEELTRTLDRHIKKFGQRYLVYVESGLSEKDRNKVREKEGKGEESVKELNSRYKRTMPFIRLLLKVHQIKDKHKEEDTSRWSKVKAVYEKGKTIVGEGIDLISSGDEVAGNALSHKSGKSQDPPLAEWLQDHIQEAILWLMGKMGAGDKTLQVTENMMEKFCDWFEPVVSVGKLFKGMGRLVKKAPNMTREEIKDAIFDLMGNSLEAIVPALENIQKVIGELPFFGEISGLIEDAVSMVKSIMTYIDKKRFRGDAEGRKEALKAKMAEKRATYDQDDDLRDLDLYGFVGEAQKRKFMKYKAPEVHFAKEKSKKSRFRKRYTKDTSVTYEEKKQQLEEEVGQETLYTTMEEMKARKDRGQLSSEERKKYYKMKALRTIREYEEQRGSGVLNKKRMISEGIEMAHTAVDIIANICGLIPGMGTAISSGMKLFNSCAKFVRNMVSKGKKVIDISRGKQREKERKREGMAENIFNQMVFVSEYINQDEQGSLFKVLPSNAPRVAKSADYLYSTTSTLSYQISEMEEAEDRESLLDMMADAFSAG